MRTAEAFYDIFMYLYNKNILKYGQIARNGTESMIPDTEGRSNVLYMLMVTNFQLECIVGCLMTSFLILISQMIQCLRLLNTKED